MKCIMKRIAIITFCFVCISMVSPPILVAQSENSQLDKELPDLLDPEAKTDLNPEPYDIDGITEWQYYLYRFLAIGIGSFPFSLLASTIIYDTYKVIDQSIASNQFESKYLPLFFGGSEKPSYSSDDVLRVLLIGGGVSLFVASIDLIISLVQKSYQNSSGSLFYGIQ